MNKLKITIETKTERSEEEFFKMFKQVMQEQLRDFTLQIGERIFIRKWQETGNQVEKLKEKKPEQQRSI